MNVVDFPKPEKGSYGADIIGPFEEFKVTLGGYRVPYVSARPLPNDMVDVSIDGRFGMEPVSRDEFNKWLYVLANAMAVAAGYSSHGENCAPLNHFKVKVIGLGEPPK